MTLLDLAVEAAERGLVPDAWMRRGIRRECRRRIARHDPQGESDFVRSLEQGPIALSVDAANRQHYEIPAEFFEAVLGPRLKYSCCFFPSSTTDLAAAEEESLAVTCSRAELTDGQRILELGCGWGSLSLWMAEHYPRCRITAVSNSQSQRRFVEQRARNANLTNLEVITADVNDFAPAPQRFDRVVSVEMFEHMRNFDLLLARIADWLVPRGKLFVHVFCHRELTYPFAVDGDADWMARHFFTGGMMPSYELLPTFSRRLRVVERNRWSGVHYQRTAEAWLANLDANRARALPALAQAYGRRNAARWHRRWRMFFLAVAELFAANEGAEWFVAHYLFEPVEAPAATVAK
jgi:cyclopropane-fatty-acyl-phospholipid synthase